MKRNMNKILGATAMLLVSVLMLGTASFAWFAMNTRSVADGLTVEAYTDSNFLEISKNGSVYDTDITYDTNNTGTLRLITYKRFNASEIVSGLVATAGTGTYVTGDTNKYYKAVEADMGTNYIYVPMTSETHGASSTAGLVKDPVFTLVTEERLGDDGKKYFKLEKNAYVRIDNPETISVKGYYVGVYGDAEPTGSEYTGSGTYYSWDGTKFSKVSGLHVGADLSQYYTITSNTVTLTENQKGDGLTVYYLKNGNDYSYVGTVSNEEYVKNYIYWGRAYSDKADEEQADNTLSIIDEANAKEYYLQQTLFLRQAEGTNLANNLRVEEIRIGGATNALNDALRVLLVASSSSDPTNIVTSLYDAGTGTFDNQLLFAKLLGNEAETITVDVYIFFDGTDPVAKNTTMVGATLNGQSVEIEFAIDELPYNQ